MKREIVSMAFVLLLFFMMFSSLPLVSAVYTVEEHYMPSEPDDSEPVCAMKTKTDGDFYMPYVATDLLKIEMLFDNQNINGDQGGNTSLYPTTISHWPNGFVDMIWDIRFIVDKFGAYEGGSEWDYMADIVSPYRQIDMFDTRVAAKNFGKSGAYVHFTAALNINVTFYAGEVQLPDVRPDDYGFVTIPQGATRFRVKNCTNGNFIGAMVLFYGPSKPPIAYSTTFDFAVPAYTGGDVGKEVWYYVLTRLYVPSGLSGQNFYFVATADDRVQNVKMNGYSKTGSGSSVNIDVGILGGGYHLLEFEFVDVSGGGSLSFHAATDASQYAWLSRFRTYAPNYSNNEYRYTVKTHSNFSISDRYFIKGFADDYIDDVKLGGGWLYQDWQWESYNWKTIYAWDDGFNVPCGYLDPAAWRDIEMVWGVKSGGLLDFQILSFTEQPEKIARGTPEFMASVDSYPYTWGGRILDRKFYAGSEWCGEPGLSERKIVAGQEIYFAEYRDVPPYDLFGDAKVRLEVGVGWLDWIMGPSDTSFGVMLNLTYLGGVQKPYDYVTLRLVDIEIRTPAQALKILGMEFKDIEGGKSIVSSTFEILGSISIAAATYLAAVYNAPVGAMLAIIGGGEMVKSMFNFAEGTQETPCIEYPDGDFHEWVSWEQIGQVSEGNSVNEVIFIKVDPFQATHCGFVEINCDCIINAWSGGPFAESSVRVFYTIYFPIYVTG